MMRVLWLVNLIGTLVLCCSAQSPLDQILNKVENNSQPTTSQPAANNTQNTPPAGLSLSDSKIADAQTTTLLKEVFGKL